MSIVDICQDLHCPFGVCHNSNGTAVCLCPEDACIGADRPVCADDGKTYQNMCELTVQVSHWSTQF